MTFTLDLADIDFVGRDLQRPECVLCTADGSLFAADWRGGVCRIALAPDGRATVVVEDYDLAVLDAAEAAYRDGTLGRPHLDQVPAGPLKNISSLAFGGPDLRTAYVGCLLGDRIARFRSPVAGLEPVHWHYG